MLHFDTEILIFKLIKPHKLNFKCNLISNYFLKFYFRSAYETHDYSGFPDLHVLENCHKGEQTALCFPHHRVQNHH